MKQINNIGIIASILGSAMVILAGCSREIEDPSGIPGSRIQFTASSYYDNGPSTRTVYSGTGAFSGSTLTTERINWVAGDQISIAYAHGGTTNSANYDVTANTVVSTTNSEATIGVASGSSELVWADGSGNHVFYAMYPSRAFSLNGNSASLSGNAFSGIIPASQTVTLKTLESGASKYEPNMKYAYMLATATEASQPVNNGVNLYFKPAMTAFEFIVDINSGTSGLGVTLNSFTMTAASGYAPLAGTFSASLNGTSAAVADWTGYSRTSTSQTITVNFAGGSGVTVNPGSPVTFTVFALPETLSGITITFNTSDGQKTLALKDSNDQFVSFTGGKKYRITNLAMPLKETWTYTVEDISDITLTAGHGSDNANFAVKSYRTSNLDPNTKEPVKWKIQYFEDPTTTYPDGRWLDLPAAGFSPDANTTFTVNTRTGDGVNNSTYSSGEGRTASITGTSVPQTTGNFNAPDVHRAALANGNNGNPRGTQSAPFDLSTHPVYGNINGTVPQTTANTYVVSAPGYYMFPLVYGNARTNGSDNVSAYNPGASTDPVVGESFNTLAGVQANKNIDANYWTYYTPQFYNAINKPITSPWIETDLGSYGTVSGLTPVVVWQDTEVGDEIIPYANNSSGYLGISTFGGVKYIWFRVDQDRIQPANLVIALRGSVSGFPQQDSDILWSWQIWFTEKDLTPTDVISNNAGTFNLMPYNLGWSDPVDSATSQWPDRSVRYRVVQVESDYTTILTGGANDEFEMTQPGDQVSLTAQMGSNPMYQWGRKDPMIPPISDTESKHVSPNPLYAADIPANGVVINGREIGPSPSPDFGPGIRKPYLPYSNYIDSEGHGSTAWIGGTYYPWYKTRGFLPNRLDSNPFTYGQAITMCNARLTVNGLVSQGTGSFINQYIPGWGATTDPNAYVYFIDHYNPDLANHPMTAAEVQMVLFDQTNHFTLADFDWVDTPYTAAQRTNSSALMNLWNSYIYQEDTPYSQANKYKTVYDPCPPGFTVPTNKVFLADIAPSQMARGANYVVEKVHGAEMNALPSVVSMPVSGMNIGLNFTGSAGTVFFPFTGTRSFGRPSGGILPASSLGPSGAGGGFYWTDHPFQIDQADDRPGGNFDFTDIRAFSFHHSAYMFACNETSLNIVQSWTRSLEATIRPMVDPQVQYGGSSPSPAPLPNPVGASVQPW